MTDLSLPAGLGDESALGGHSFDSLWESQMRPALTACEQERQKAVMFFGIALIFGVLLAYAESLFLGPLVHNRYGGFDFRWPLATVLLAGMAGFVPIRRVARTAKTDVIEALADPLGVTYSDSGLPPAFTDFQRLRLLPGSSRQRFEDFFSGRRGQAAFELCEARLIQGSGRSETTVFRGQILRLETPRRLSSTTVVLRRSAFLESFARPEGLAPVGLEDPAFDKVFQVFGSDQVEAREILTPKVMEELMALESAYGGEKLRCAFEEGQVLIALESGNRFEIGGMFSSLVDRARAQSIAADVSQVLRLVDAFAGL